MPRISLAVVGVLLAACSGSGQDPRFAQPQPSARASTTTTEGVIREIRIAPDVLGPRFDGDGSLGPYYEQEGFEVRSDAPLGAVVGGLVATGRRWQGVTYGGHDLSALLTGDLSDFDRAIAKIEAESGLLAYTPNYVHPVTRGSAGPQLIADCKGVVSQAMATTVFAILKEELARAGVTDADVLPLSQPIGEVLGEIDPSDSNG